MSLFDIGLSGLRVSQYAMQLISTNISHATDPFYSRRTMDITGISMGQFGSGVRVADVKRVVDTMANQQLLKTQSDTARSSVFYERISLLEKYLDNDDTSVSKFINASLSGLEALNVNPGSTQYRQNYLNQLQNMLTSIKDVDKRYEADRSNSITQLDSELQSVNFILENIANINDRLRFMASQDNAEGMSLMDDRDKLLSDLAEKIDFSSNVQSNGVVDIQFSNGSSLLMDNKPVKLVRMVGEDGYSISIGMEMNGVRSPVNNLFNSGTISGLISYTETLDTSKLALNRMSLEISDRINKQHHLGVDLDGMLGGSLFRDINSAYLQSDRVMAFPANAGTANMQVAIVDANALALSDYTLVFDSATHFALTRKSDGMVLQSADITAFPTDIAVDGFSLHIESGSFNPGDSYTISPLYAAARNMAMNIVNPDKLALGYPIVTTADSANVGKGSITLDTVLDTGNIAFALPKQLHPPVRVEFINATTYRLINTTDNSVIEDNLSYDPQGSNIVFPTPAGYDPGYRVSLAGPMQAGDRFNIDYNNNGTGDNRNGMMLADAYRTSDTHTGFSELYQSLMLDLSLQSQSANINYQSHKILSDQAQWRRDEQSAVDLEEEMMNLSRYQEFYLANAQVLNTIKQTMDSLFSLLRG